MRQLLLLQEVDPLQSISLSFFQFNPLLTSLLKPCNGGYNKYMYFDVGGIRILNSRATHPLNSLSFLYIVSVIFPH